MKECRITIESKHGGYHVWLGGSHFSIGPMVSQDPAMVASEIKKHLSECDKMDLDSPKCGWCLEAEEL